MGMGPPQPPGGRRLRRCKVGRHCFYVTICVLQLLVRERVAGRGGRESNLASPGSLAAFAQGQSPLALRALSKRASCPWGPLWHVRGGLLRGDAVVERSLPRRRLTRVAAASARAGEALSTNATTPDATAGPKVGGVVATQRKATARKGAAAKVAAAASAGKPRARKVSEAPPASKRKRPGKSTAAAAANVAASEKNVISDILEASEDPEAVQEEEGAGQKGEGAAAPAGARRRRKKDTWSDDALLREFALKAIMLLREAGGEMDSNKFRKRWKYTFPNDEISRYARGRRVSTAKLLQSCGTTFTVRDFAGGGRKKMLSITDEPNREEGSTVETAEGVDIGQVASVDWGDARGPSASADSDVLRPLTGGDRLAALREAGARMRREEATPSEEALVVEEDGESVGVTADPQVSQPPWSQQDASDKLPAGLYTDSIENYQNLHIERSDDMKIYDPMSSGEDMLDWDLEQDGEIPKRHEGDGACSELCCELPVGDAECARNVVSGLDLIESFKAMGITFGNVLSYNALLDMCGQAANEGTSQYANCALSVLEMMRENRVLPNANSYSAVIRSCCQSQAGLSKAIEVVKEMRQAGLEPARQDYYLLFDACTKEMQQGNSLAVEQGLVVLETMVKSQLVPDVNRCLAMMSVIPRDGAWCNYCRDKVVEMMEESGLEFKSVQEARDLASLLNTEPPPADLAQPDAYF